MVARHSEDGSRAHLLWFARGAAVTTSVRIVWRLRLMLKLVVTVRDGCVIVSHIQQVVHDVVVGQFHVCVPQQLSLHLTQLRQVILFKAHTR